nr:Chain C, Serine/threonine-protein kinase D2 [Homo sapiens]
RQASLSISV